MNRRRLFRCRHDQRVAGVAAGLAEYLDIDIALVRVLWVVSVFFTGGFTLLAYIVMAIVVPLEPAMMPPAGPWQPGSSQWGTPAPGWTSPAGAAGPVAGPAAPGANPGDPGTGAYGDPASAPGADGAPGTDPSQASYAGNPGPYWVPNQSWVAPRHSNLAPYFGIVLIIFGALALIDQFVPWNHAWLLPAFIFALGVLLVVRSLRRDEDQ